MVLRTNADAEILPWAIEASTRASSPEPYLGLTAVDGPVLLDIWCELEEGVCVCTLFVRRGLDSNSTHEERLTQARGWSKSRRR